ncbi:MAG: hypothetical protein WC344_00025 [Bacilli bacterium]|jgi:tetratricopeptide (TPR) repeat protein
MSKGVCPHCHAAVTNDLAQSITRCPNCQKEYLTSQSDRLYNIFYSQYSSNGNIALNTSRNYEKALSEYQKLAALDGDSIEAIFGIAHSRLSLTKLGGNIVSDIITIIEEKQEKILAKTDYYPEIARNFIDLGQRQDAFFEKADKNLKNGFAYLDGDSKKRALELADETLALWLFIDKFFSDEYITYDEERKLIADRIVAIRETRKVIDACGISTNPNPSYSAVKDKIIFDSRVAVYKVHLAIIISQFVFVIAAIVGFSIMMVNYSINPLPGAIVFGVFASLFLVTNLIGRAIKRKLSQ